MSILATWERQFISPQHFSDLILFLNLPAHALAVAVVTGDEGVADAGAGRRLGVAVVLLAHLPAGPSLVPRG